MVLDNKNRPRFRHELLQYVGCLEVDGPAAQGFKGPSVTCVRWAPSKMHSPTGPVWGPIRTNGLQIFENLIAGRRLNRRRAIVEELQGSLKLELLVLTLLPREDIRVQRIESHFLYLRILSVAEYNPGILRPNVRRYKSCSPLLSKMLPMSQSSSVCFRGEELFSGWSDCNLSGMASNYHFTVLRTTASIILEAVSVLTRVGNS